MSTLKATNLSHASAASPNIVLDSAGKVTFGGAVAGAGMDLITPTSVAGTGVTLSGGQVSFSAASTVSVNGCFTSVYDNYIVAVRMLGSNDDVVSWRLRTSGSDITAANYDWNYLSIDSAVNVPTRSANQTSSRYGRVGTSVGSSEMFISGPALAAPTHNSHTVIYGLGISQVMVTGYHQLSTSYDGFSIIPAAGTLTGTLRVYGLRNS
jgi:hypothetical protein